MYAEVTELQFCESRSWQPPGNAVLHTWAISEPSKRQWVSLSAALMRVHPYIEALAAQQCSCAYEIETNVANLQSQKRQISSWLREVATPAECQQRGSHQSTEACKCTNCKQEALNTLSTIWSYGHMEATEPRQLVMSGIRLHSMLVYDSLNQ